ncbi:hypothetical protein AWW66_17520 [Micromonospora rosaria]|uniref:Uncharacterized protein n=2 Tax=Micromonospora rosaria TaxID=47874 RepID=A0A136PQC8_9ACTN|nr:hypothetical protein AWW66_17520 [Micromonospora rosaria]
MAAAVAVGRASQHPGGLTRYGSQLLNAPQLRGLSALGGPLASAGKAAATAAAGSGIDSVSGRLRDGAEALRRRTSGGKPQVEQAADEEPEAEQPADEESQAGQAADERSSAGQSADEEPSAGRPAAGKPSSKKRSGGKRSAPDEEPELDEQPEAGDDEEPAERPVAQRRQRRR